VPISTPIPPVLVEISAFKGFINPDVVVSLYISILDSTGSVSNTFKFLEKSGDIGVARTPFCKSGENPTKKSVSICATNGLLLASKYNGSTYTVLGVVKLLG
jgi:hypothetical protein